MNDLYEWTPPATESVGASANGLNQITVLGGQALSGACPRGGRSPNPGNARGNLIDDGTWSYTGACPRGGRRPNPGNVENRLRSISGPASVTLEYDPLGRLAASTVAGLGATEFLYDGQDLVAEFDGAGNVIRRYVHGPGVDEESLMASSATRLRGRKLARIRSLGYPRFAAGARSRLPRPVGPRRVWYEGAGTSDPRFLHADERGSVVALSNASGSAIANFAYSPYGKAEGASFSRFGFTGQTVIEGTEVMHFKARAYSPALGRFLQPDPIGFAGGDLNLYAYAANDPVNFTDPTGLFFGKLFKKAKKLAKKVVKTAGKVGKFAVFLNPELSLGQRVLRFAAAQALDFAVGGSSGGSNGGADRGLPAGPPSAGNTAALPVVVGVTGLFPQVLLNHLRGKREEDRIATLLQERGCSVVRQVTLEDPATGLRARIDLVAHPAGELSEISERGFIEVKSGPGSRFSANQLTVIAAIIRGTAIPRGKNAEAAGLSPGVPLSEQGLNVTAAGVCVP